MHYLCIPYSLFYIQLCDDGTGTLHTPFLLSQPALHYDLLIVLEGKGEVREEGRLASF